MSGEWWGFTNQPWGRDLINFLPEEESLALDTFATWLHLFENLRHYSWIIGRFHVATTVYQRPHRGRRIYAAYWSGGEARRDQAPHLSRGRPCTGARAQDSDLKAPKGNPGHRWQP